MEFFKNFEQLNLIIIILVIILFIWNIVLSINLIITSKRINRFTRGGEITDLEGVIGKYVKEVKKMSIEISDNTTQINGIKDRISYLKGYVEIIRYNAFDKEGQDLSYSIAFLDQKKNGVVITSIYNRDGSNTYAKPIIDGSSTYKLSREEITVLDNAIKNI